MKSDRKRGQLRGFRRGRNTWERTRNNLRRGENGGGGDTRSIGYRHAFDNREHFGRGKEKKKKMMIMGGGHLVFGYWVFFIFWKSRGQVQVEAWKIEVQKLGNPYLIMSINRKFPADHLISWPIFEIFTLKHAITDLELCVLPNQW